MSSNPSHGKMYSIQHQWLAAGRWFSPGTPVFFTNKTDCCNKIIYFWLDFYVTFIDVLSLVYNVKCLSCSKMRSSRSRRNLLVWVLYHSARLSPLWICMNVWLVPFNVHECLYNVTSTVNFNDCLNIFLFTTAYEWNWATSYACTGSLFNDCNIPVKNPVILQLMSTLHSISQHKHL